MSSCAHGALHADSGPRLLHSSLKLPPAPHLTAALTSGSPPFPPGTRSPRPAPYRDRGVPGLHPSAFTPKTQNWRALCLHLRGPEPAAATSPPPASLHLRPRSRRSHSRAFVQAEESPLGTTHACISHLGSQFPDQPTSLPRVTRFPRGACLGAEWGTRPTPVCPLDPGCSPHWSTPPRAPERPLYRP